MLKRNNVQAYFGCSYNIYNLIILCVGVSIIRERLLVIQELYSKSLNLKDERWRNILLGVYNELLKNVDRHEVRADHIRGLE